MKIDNKVAGGSSNDKSLHIVATLAAEGTTITVPCNLNKVNKLDLIFRNIMDYSEAMGIVIDNFVFSNGGILRGLYLSYTLANGNLTIEVPQYYKSTYSVRFIQGTYDIYVS